jgi:hypothetical protein
MTQNTCKRCDHRWYPRTSERSVYCPKCRSAYWDRMKKVDAESKDQKKTIASVSQWDSDQPVDQNDPWKNDEFASLRGNG